MDRREFALVSMSVLVAGCTGGRQGEASNGNTPNDNTPNGTSTETATEATETETDTEQPAPSIRLQVLFKTDLKAMLSLERLSDNEVVFEETEEYTDGEKVNLTSKFEANTNYRFTITNTKDEIIWERGIYDYEGYVLEVNSKTEVEVVQHEEY